MDTAKPLPADSGTLRGNPALNRLVKEHARADNHSNWGPILGVHAVIAATVALVLGAETWCRAAGLSPWWLLPLYVLAVLVIGASQHQLAGAGHEASHHTLFRNRLLNELTSDWLCMFPLFSTTYQFRLYHLQHHQFVNDPDRDPDFAMLDRSGHWMEFPVEKEDLKRMLWKQATVLPLLRHVLARLRYNALGMHERSPYRATTPASPTAGFSKKIGGLYSLGLILLVAGAAATGRIASVWYFLPVLWLGLAVVFLLLPASWFPQERLRPVIHPRHHAMMRTGFLTLLLTGLCAAEALTRFPALAAYLLLWGVPLATAFPLCLILRQLVQHGNADRGWLTNTRVFHVHPVLRYAIFPFGMDYHLPHHMFATVPHHRLPSLHRALLDFPDYRRDCVETEHYFHSDAPPPRKPTVAEVLGPEYAPDPGSGDVFVDDSVLDNCDIAEKERILEESRQSRAGSASPRSATLTETGPPTGPAPNGPESDAGSTSRSPGPPS
jgi:fatty acid desaturase